MMAPMATRYLLQIDSKPQVDQFRLIATLPEIVAGLESNAHYPPPLGPMFATLAEKVRDGASSGSYFTNLCGRVVRWSWSIGLPTADGAAGAAEFRDGEVECEYDEDVSET